MYKHTLLYGSVALSEFRNFPTGVLAFSQGLTHILYQ